MALTKEAILNTDDLKTETVPVPEWGGDVIVRTMSGTERDAYEQAIFERNGKDSKFNMDNMRARLCAGCIVDDKGACLFSAQDAAELGKKSGKVLDRIYTVATRLCGMSAEDIDTLAKNSKADLNDNSTSA